MPRVEKTLPPTRKASTRASPPGNGSVLDRIRPIEAGDEGLKVLLYGKSGTGKTTVWATFPGPILVALASGGKRPGELKSVATEEYADKIFQAELYEAADLRVLIDEVRDNPKRFATVVLDHASGFQDLVLKEVLGLAEIPVSKDWGMADKRDYGRAVTICKEYFRALLNLTGNVVFIAQERVFGKADEEGGSEFVDPKAGAALFPSLTDWLNPSVDYIVETFVRPKTVEVTRKIGNAEKTRKERTGEYEYCARTGPDDFYTTKFRVPKDRVKPPLIVDPSYEKIAAIIRGEEIE